MQKKIFYQGFCENLIQNAADFLSFPQSAGSVTDLSDCIAVLPGKNMIRELSRELAKTECGIFPPVMLTPSSFLRFGLPDNNTASDMEQQQIWLSILNDIEPKTYQSLCPVSFQEQNQTLLRNVASDLVTLRRELSRNGHTFASAAEALQETFDSRWQDLAGLEQYFLDRLKQEHLVDPTAEIIAAVNDVSAFSDYKKLILISTPDLPPVAIERLKNILAQTEIEIHIFIAAPDPEETEYKEHFFDEWGQIIPEVWKHHALPVDETHHILHAVNNPAEAAALAAALVQQDGIFDTENTITAIADPAVFPDFEKAFSVFRKEDSGEHLSIYDPAGISIKKLRIVPVLKLLDALGEDTSPATVNLFLRNHDLGVYFAKKAGFASVDRMLAAADHYFLAKMPDKLHSGLPDPKKDHYQEEPATLKKLFDLLQDTHAFFAADNKDVGVQEIRDLLEDIFSAENYPPVRGVAFNSEETEVRKALSAIEKSSMFNSLPCRELLKLLILSLQDQICYPEHEQDSLEICGFLDLPFKSAKNIILCGVNDGLIPEKASPNPFLTDTKRKLLGLPDNDTRYARDCFYLSYLLQNTARDGKKLHLVAWEFNRDLTPARFSPLLFNGCDEELLKRIRTLYPKSREKSVAVPHCGSNTITLQPDFTKTFVKQHTDGTEQLILSVTDFKSFLESPLRAFFNRSEQMNNIDYERLDLDNADFGTVCHAVLEKIKNTFDAAAEDLYKSMEAELASCMKQMFGYPLPILIGIQQDILKKRLYHAAEEIAKSSGEFICIETEWELGGREQNGIPYHDAIIRGTIDRIELSRDRSTLRLIDFKTFSKKKSPAEAHLRTDRQHIQHFSDLQLPLYKLLLPLDDTFWKIHPELNKDNIRIVCGYFCLPTAVTETGYILWDDLSDELMEHADKQVKAIIDNVTEMQKYNICYDDSTKTIPYDNFADILLPDKTQALPTVRFEPFELISWKKAPKKK